MKKFLVVYHAPDTLVAASTEPTPEEMAKGMEPWMAWAARCGDQLIDFGQPLISGQQLRPDGSNNPSTREVRGYSMVQANDMESALELFKGHPHLDWDASCAIEIHEVNPLPGTE